MDGDIKKLERLYNHWFIDIIIKNNSILKKPFILEATFSIREFIW